METIEGNKLIAEFMGAECETDDFDRVTNEYDLFGAGLLPDISGFDPDAKHFYTPDQMKFHESWDWLMPVVEKIHNLYDLEGCPPEIYEIEEFLLIRDELCTGRIETSFHAVVEFIKWYNQNRK